MADRFSDRPLPPYRHVPGRTPHPTRDPDGHSYGQEEPELPSLNDHRWQDCSHYLYGIDLFNEGYWWECHEVLEPIWMQTPNGSAERDMVQAVIQLANARLKLRMALPRAARRLCDMVTAHLARCPQDRPILGLHAREVAAWVRETQGKTV